MWLLTTVFFVAAGLCVLVVLKSRTRPYERSSAISMNTSVRPVRQSEGISPLKTKKESARTAEVESGEEWWTKADAEYFWVVLCKNERFHRRVNPARSHRIPLGRTDTISGKPVTTAFQVHCDSCGTEYVYMPSEVMRWEMESPEPFDPHPLFRD